MMDISKLLPQLDDGHVYLDNAASTAPLPELVQALPQISAVAFVNPSATTTRSHALKRAIDKLSKQFKAAAKLTDAELIWTAGGTESNNLALLGSAPAAGGWLGREIVTTTTEHPSVEQPLRRLESQGAIVKRVAVDASGKLNMNAFSAALSPATHLVSICLVQSETGAKQDLTAIRDCMDRRCPRARLHVDGVQALTKEDLHWDQARVDLMSFSGHKCHAIGATGLLAVKPQATVNPITFGGGQQGGLRSGSLDGVGILGFLHATTHLLEQADHARQTVAEFNVRVREKLRELIPETVFNSSEDASPFILNASLPGYEGAVLMRLLDTMGVTIGTGSACSAGSSNPSQTLTAMGRDRKTAFSAIRISFGYTTTSDDVGQFLERLESALERY